MYVYSQIQSQIKMTIVAHSTNKANYGVRASIAWEDTLTMLGFGESNYLKKKINKSIYKYLVANVRHGYELTLKNMVDCNNSCYRLDLAL